MLSWCVKFMEHGWWVFVSNCFVISMANVVLCNKADTCCPSFPLIEKTHDCGETITPTPACPSYGVLAETFPPPLNTTVSFHQNEMNKTLSMMRSDMEAIDREALMARVAMEKRIKTSLKRLVDRFESIERRFARLERSDERRAALEAGGSAAPLETGKGSRRALLMPASGSDSDDQHKRKLQMSCVTARGKLGDGGGQIRLAYSADDGRVSSITTESCTVASEEDFGDSGDESENEIVRMLSEKMSALESKLLLHEKGGEAGKCTVNEMGTAGVNDGLGVGSAVRA